MVICAMVSDAKWWEIIVEANFLFCNQNVTRNWTFDKFNFFITSEAIFLVVFWLLNEKFASKTISHHFASLTIEQITIII